MLGFVSWTDNKNVMDKWQPFNIIWVSDITSCIPIDLPVQAFLSWLKLKPLYYSWNILLLKYSVYVLCTFCPLWLFNEILKCSISFSHVLKFISYVIVYLMCAFKFFIKLKLNRFFKKHLNILQSYTNLILITESLNLATLVIYVKRF